MLSFKAYLAEKKSKILINPKKDELKDELKEVKKKRRGCE